MWEERWGEEDEGAGEEEVEVEEGGEVVGCGVEGVVVVVGRGLRGVFCESDFG